MTLEEIAKELGIKKTKEEYLIEAIQEKTWENTEKKAKKEMEKDIIKKIKELKKENENG